MDRLDIHEEVSVLQTHFTTVKSSDQSELQGGRGGGG